VRKFTLFIGGLAVLFSVSAAVAVPTFPTNNIAPQSIEFVRSCPAGTHPGYRGKYCWRNHGHACPPGYHRGYL